MHPPPELTSLPGIHLFPLVTLQGGKHKSICVKARQVLIRFLGYQQVLVQKTPCQLKTPPWSTQNHVTARQGPAGDATLLLHHRTPAAPMGNADFSFLLPLASVRPWVLES